MSYLKRLWHWLFGPDPVDPETILQEQDDPYVALGGPAPPNYLPTDDGRPRH